VRLARAARNGRMERIRREWWEREEGGAVRAASEFVRSVSTQRVSDNVDKEWMVSPHWQTEVRFASERVGGCAGVGGTGESLSDLGEYACRQPVAGRE
jgi:hypothetical protein